VRSRVAGDDCSRASRSSPTLRLGASRAAICAVAFFRRMFWLGSGGDGPLLLLDAQVKEHHGMAEEEYAEVRSDAWCGGVPDASLHACILTQATWGTLSVFSCRGSPLRFLFPLSGIVRC
jgi:hypothetical protein